MGISKISAYSLANAIIFFSVGLLVIKRLRRNTKFLVNNGITALMVLLMLSVIRVLLPLDFSHALVIPSDTVLPVIQKVTDLHVGSFTIGSLIIGIWFVGTSFASMGIIISAFICSYLIIIQPVSLPCQNEAECRFDVTAENAYILICRDKTIEIYVDGEKFTTVNEKDLDMPPLRDLTVHTEQEKHE